MRINVMRLCEACPDLEAGGAEKIGDGILDWLRRALPLTLTDMPEPIRHPGFEPDMPEEIDVFLGTREEMDLLDYEDRLLGAFIVHTPDSDPFGDEAPLARRLRVIVVIEKDEIEKRLADEIDMDGEAWARHLHEYETAEAATGFHEVAHAVLFAANSGMLSPHAVDSASACGDLQNDVFDMASGYGIRGLPIDGQEIWADDAEEATELMERWCEEVGRRAAREANAALGQTFYEALGIDPAEVAAQTLGEGCEPR